MSFIIQTLGKKINMVCKMHNTTAWNEKLFWGKLNNWYQWCLSKDGVEHYAINSLFDITMMTEKYVRMYEKLITQLWMYSNVIRVF